MGGKKTSNTLINLIYVQTYPEGWPCLLGLSVSTPVHQARIQAVSFSKALS